MKSTGSSRGSQGNRGNRGNRGGQGRSRGEDQRGQQEPTMSESSVEANRDGTHQPAAPLTSRPGEPMHLGNLLTAGPQPMGHPTSTTRNTSIAASPARAPSGVGPAIGGHGEQRPSHPLSSSHPSRPLPEPMAGLTNTTRNMSIASTPAQAPLGVGPDIGGHGEQYRGTLGHGPGLGHAQILEQSQSGTVPEDEFLAHEDCNACLKAKKDNYCDRKKRCAPCIKRNVQCVYPPAGSFGDDPSKPEKYKSCDYCRAHKKGCNRHEPCSTCIRYDNEGKNCHYTDIPTAIQKPARKAVRTKAVRTIGSSGVALSQKEKYKTCNYCRDHQTKSCNGKEPCSICIKRDNRGVNCTYEVKYRDEPANSGSSGRKFYVDEIVFNVRIRRDDDSDDFVYVHAPTHIPRPQGLAENMIIGWDRLRASWVIRYGPSHGNLRGRRPGDIGLNAAGEHAYMIDEHEGGGGMGGMMDMRTPATASRPPAQPQGFDVPGPSAPAHSVQGPSLAGRVHQRGSTESPPADDHHDPAKRQRKPPQK